MHPLRGPCAFCMAGTMRGTWIEDVVAVLEHGSITAAAEARNVSQPAFSRRLRGIEAAFGITLFDRSERPVTLHPDLAPLASRLRALAGEIRQLETALRIAAGRSSGVVVAAQHALSTVLAARIVDRIGHLGPEGGVRLRSANRGECVSMVLMAQADIAILYRDADEEAGERDARLETVDLASDVFMPVACSAAMASPDARGLPLVAYPGEVFLGRLFAERIAPRLVRGTRLRPRAETALTLTALQLAIDGAGVAWVPARLARRALAAGALVDLSPGLPTALLRICAMRRRERSGRVARRAWELLTTQLDMPAHGRAGRADATSGTANAEEV